MKQLPLVIASGPSPSFDNFLPGANAEALAAWLAADRAKRARPSLMGWAVGAAWPLIQGLRGHPSVSLAAGALVQRLLRPAPATLVVPAPVVASPPVLHQGLALVRRHPGTTVAMVAEAPKDEAGAGGAGMGGGMGGMGGMGMDM